jgi:histone deacetylase complex regulatory component SIN3
MLPTLVVPSFVHLLLQSTINAMLFVHCKAMLSPADSKSNAVLHVTSPMQPQTTNSNCWSKCTSVQQFDCRQSQRARSARKNVSLI